MHDYLVEVRTGFFRYRSVRVNGKRTPGAAARTAFRHLIRSNTIRRQPITDHDTGGWKGVTIRTVAATPGKAAA